MEKSSIEKKEIAKANQVFCQLLAEIRTVAEWAVKMGYKDSKLFSLHYRRMFKKNPKKAMVELRLEKAKKLLLEKKHVKNFDVAQKVGLSDEIALYQYFIRHEGKSPSDIKDSKK